MKAFKFIAYSLITYFFIDYIVPDDHTIAVLLVMSVGALGWILYFYMIYKVFRGLIGAIRGITQ